MVATEVGITSNYTQRHTPTYQMHQTVLIDLVVVVVGAPDTQIPDEGFYNNGGRYAGKYILGSPSMRQS